MLPNITVRRQTSDLTAREWTFCLIDRDLRCVEYRELDKPSRRHRTERVVASWSWYTRNRSWLPPTLPADVPWDPAIGEEAKTQLLAMISVVAPGDK